MIDYIFGSIRVKEYCTRAGITPFGLGYHSDHRALFVTIDIEKILQSKTKAIDSITARKLQQTTPKERQIFLETVHYHFENQNVYERLKKLVNAPQEDWTSEHTQVYENCDQQMITGMLSAEIKTRKTNTTSWSPIFGKAVSTKAFWKIALSLKMTHTRPSDDYIQWAQQMGIMDFKGIDIVMIKKNLRLAQKRLREIESQADTLREQHLRQLLTESELQGEGKQVQKRISILIRAHEQRKHFRRLKQIFKPRESAGLSYILVPQNFSPNNFPYDPSTVSNWEPIHDHDELQSIIQMRNIHHFGQAHGTPFTTPPLAGIQWQANSIEVKELIDGTIPTTFLSGNPFIQKIIQYIADKERLPPIDMHITPEQVGRGFRRWHESTSTSPSGCHLGLCRISSFPCEDKFMEEL